MKRPLPLVVLLVITTELVAQVPYGNEWIEHTRQYWKFEVVEDGLYRIDSLTLAQAGFPVASVDPAHLMLFGREEQVPLYVQDGGDGVLNAADFIEFQALANDGWLDRWMYGTPDQQTNPRFSLYNDTIRYFLTWDAEAPKARIAAYANTNFASTPQRPWCWSESFATFAGLTYFPGLQADNFSSGFITEGEGWMRSSVILAPGTPAQVESATSLSTQGRYTGADAPPALVRIRTASLNSPSLVSSPQPLPEHHLQFGYGPAPGTWMVDTVFAGVKVVRTSFQVPAAELGNNNHTVRIKALNDLNGPGQVGSVVPNYVSRHGVAMISLRYARQFLMGSVAQRTIWLPPVAGEQVAHIDFGSFIGSPIVYAWGDTLRRIVATQSGSRWKAMVPLMPGGTDTQVLLHSVQTVRNVTNLRPVNNGTGYFTDFSQLPADSALLIVTHQTLMNAALQYAAYRENSARNPHPTVVADVDELYDQFGGGIPKNALAIRRWARFMLLNTSSGSDPAGLLLVGKSIQTPNTTQRRGYRNPDMSVQVIRDAYAACLVPTFGHPTADPCFTIGLRFDPRRMEIPVGRLSARTPQQVLDYLAKVQATEGQAPGAWMKNVLHFRGGLTPGETQVFNAYFTQYEMIAQDTLFGARTHRFGRQTSNIFEQVAADSVRFLIEDPDQGVTLMTFFAHAAASSFDITIDNPANYNWQGKHPLVIGNSCYIGNTHTMENNSAAEVWTLMPNAGPIAFLATTELGSAPFLNVYTRQFYQSFCRENYHRGIGEHMRSAAFTQLQNGLNEVRHLQHAHTFSLQGDPTLLLNTWPKPDYAVRDQDISLVPATVSADVDTFEVHVRVRNIGKAVPATFAVEAERIVQGTPLQTRTTTLENVFLEKTAVLRFPNSGLLGSQGPNTINVRVDLNPDEVDELDNTFNNSASLFFSITSGDIIPAWPYDYAITPQASLELKATTGDPLAPVRTYVFEIDTTDLFNSPIAERATVAAPGGVVTWQPQNIFSLNTFQDSTVFFWRTSIDSAGNNGYNWYERSFQYIPGRTGWGQAHHFQFEDNTYNLIEHDRQSRDFDFVTGTIPLTATTLQNVGSDEVYWQLGFSPQASNGCSGSTAAWHVAVIDPSSFEPWGVPWTDANTGITVNAQNAFGQHPNCRNYSDKKFVFRTNNPSEMAAMRNMVTNEVPSGYHLLFYTWRHLDKTGMATHDPQLMPALEGLGLPAFSGIPDSVSCVFYVRKGDPSTFAGSIGTGLTGEAVTLNVGISSEVDRGTITTMRAGPARSWEGLYWNEIPQSANDSVRIQLIGVAPNGVEVELPGMEFPGAQDSVPNLGTLVDAAQFPWLRIRGRFFDIGNPEPKPSLLERWQLLYVPVPECAIHPPAGFSSNLDGIFQGQTAEVVVPVRNISTYDMDSLLVTAWVTDRNNVRRRVHYKLNGPLPAGADVMDTIRFSTWGLAGVNTLLVEANPIDTLTGNFHQVEQYRFNNVLQFRFDVGRDTENPLLDVTFDGVHIMDGDIVSARPEIRITLDDENTVLLHNSPSDTTLFKVFLTDPANNTERVYFRDGAGNEVMRFVPASGPANVAHIEYRPAFVNDGVYMLTVQASDRSGNASGQYDYRVRFEVINRPTITEVLNYPNPFTTNTRFVFTVTGSEPPTQMRIQIMTVTGRVVREVRMHELGPIRVGRNITEFAWDGTDEFGDKLARGVYLYRVIAQLNGEDIEQRQTSASGYFHKGVGKMYLLR